MIIELIETKPHSVEVMLFFLESHFTLLSGTQNLPYVTLILS